jgi:hypothetical protein
LDREPLPPHQQNVNFKFGVKRPVFTFCKNRVGGWNVVRSSKIPAKSHVSTSRGSGHGEGGQPSHARSLRQEMGLCVGPDQGGAGRIRHECVQPQKPRQQDVVEEESWEICISAGSRPGDMAEVMLHAPQIFIHELALPIVWCASSSDGVAVLR